MGYFCQNGTRYSTEFPCPSGTFNNQTNGRSLTDCEIAPGGYYVNGTGNVQVSGTCSAGFYCPYGATTATPVCNSTYCSSGGRCVPGQLCPNATVVPSPCPGGVYCADYSGAITGLCSAGYYCIQGSYTSSPVALFDSSNRTIGDVCPLGYYCLAGTAVPVSCPLGSFSAVGSSAPIDCHPCPSRYYCTSPSVQVLLKRFRFFPFKSVDACALDLMPRWLLLPFFVGLLQFDMS